MRRWRAYQPSIDESEPMIRLDGVESHHLVRVVRAQSGDLVGVFDGHGAEWEARVVEADPRAVVVRLERRLEETVEPGVAVTLYQGLCRPDRFDWVVQKATELGVARIVPLETVRSEPMRGTERRIERWTRIAVEACKQSGRRVVPEISHPTPIDRVGRHDAALVLDRDSVRSLGTLLESERSAEVGVLVGPESGLEPNEVDSLIAAGWSSGSIGPRTLRTETAGIVAVTIVLHAWSDLGPPEHR